MKLNQTVFLLLFSLLLISLASLIEIEAKQITPTNLEYYQKYVALTFDDGPDKETIKLLDELDKRNIKVTFFILGSKAAEYPEIVKRIYNSNHQIGNHTYNHLDIRQINEDKIKEEIMKTSELIKEIIGEEPKILRPGYGLFNNKVLKNSSMPIILWSIDTYDWKIKDADKLYEKNISNIKDGDIILMHDIFEWSVEAALMLIDDLTLKGYKFVTIEDLAEIKGTTLHEDEIYYHFH